ncbi:MAG TPA: TonB-dependent receptor [Vicinamibacterales bacterium]|nr:TonB-dependent receptor [Vicinamibacterales bacterium]
MGTRQKGLKSLGRGLVVAAALVALATPAAAQEFRGRINGTVSDNTGAVLPGVTVTATSPALIQPQTTTTGADGSYRFIALPAGVYALNFELNGFKTYKHEGIRVVINTTLTVDVKLEVATLQETVTVTGDSPIVDTSTTSVGTNFTKELLTEIPNARDIWAAMAQAPGLQMTGYDVGGSHTGTQTGYLTYGMSDQNTTRIEGINTTESTNANAGYFDFGSFEEFQIGGAGNMADADTFGAQLNITVKSGGDRFSATWYSDYENDSTISDNVPNELKTAGGRTKDGYFTPEPLQRGNPIDRQYDINASVGGPIWRRKAWFFYSYRLNDQYKTILGFPELARSKLTNAYTVKGTFQLPKNNQIIGYMNKREKLQDRRDFGPTTPLSASFYQASRNYPMKIEWTSVLSDRLFLDVLVGQWYNFFPLRPQTESGIWPEDQFVPGRIDLLTDQLFEGGANDGYQDRKRYKPQFTTSASYMKDGWHGSHDFKFGYEWKRDRRKEFNDQPFNIFYRDRGATAVELELYNGPVLGITDVTYHAAYLNDSWKFNDRLTLNIGARLERYRDSWPEQAHTPEMPGALRGTTDQRILDFYAPRTVAAATVAEHSVLAPRAGFAYDISGNGHTVFKAFFGRFYFNSADTLANRENPVGFAQLRYRWTDRNGNRQLDSPAEMGAFLQTLGGAGFVRIDRDVKRPYGQELSTHFEHELRQGLSGRVSYVYKNVRDNWSEVDIIRQPAYAIALTRTDSGPDGVTGTGDDRQINLVDRPAGVLSDRVWTNPGELADSEYHTVEFTANRRFRGRWMALATFSHTWLKELHGVTSTTSVLSAGGIGGTYNWRPNQQIFGRETSTVYNAKILGRYVMPFDIGVSGSWKLQSGRNWGRTQSFNLPNAGSETVRVEPIDAHRFPNVSIFDMRFDKSFRFGSYGKLTGMVDVFNLFNNGTVVNARITGGARYQEIIALLDPRIVRFGIRYEF